MGFNEFIGKLFGNKATRDMKEIKPWVDKIKAVYPEIAKLSNDELRAKTVELKKYISDSAAEEQKKIEELNKSDIISGSNARYDIERYYRNYRTGRS